MSINFPSNPSTGATFNVLGKGWIYDGYGWAALDDIIGISAGHQISITITGQAPAGPTYTIGVIDGATSNLHAGILYGVSGSIYASSLATGLLYGGLLSINAGNSAAFDITSGKGYIVNTGASFTAEPLPVITKVSWLGKTGVTLSGLTAQDTTWVYIDSSGNIHQQSTFFTDDQIQNNIAIGALVHPSRSYISLAKTIPNVSYATDKQYEQFIRAFGPMKVSGHTIQANGANMKLNRTSGTAFILGRNYPNDPNNPSVVSDNAKTDATFWRYYRGATAGTFITQTGQTVIDPAYYDNGTGTLHAVSPSKPYTIQRIFFFPGTPDVLGVYYGRAEYASISDAANNIHLEDFTEITNTSTNAILLAHLLVKYNETNLTTAIAGGTARIIQAGQFRTTTSGGGTVATKLDDLSDVSLTSIADDDLIIYDAASSLWLNTPVSHIAVSSFNGRTGAVQGVSAAFAGSGISVSGATGSVTITNTGVLSIDGATGAISYVARTNVDNNFSAGQSIYGDLTTYGVGDNSISLRADYSDIFYNTNIINQNTRLIFTGSGNTVTLPTGSGTLALTSGVISSFNGRTGAVQGVSAAVAGTGISVSGATGSVTITNTGVQSFNGSTGSITGVSSVRGLTGAVGITNGSGIGLSVSGKTMTFSNTGVLSINGDTGAITNVARTNVINYFTESQSISGTGKVLTIDDFTNSVTVYPTQLEWYNDLSSVSQYWVPNTSPNPSTITFPNETGTLALTKNVVSSFNGSTGSVSGVNSIRGLTGIVGLTNGSGISLGVSGKTLTISNTGVLSINGSTGAITNVARTNVDNSFSANQTISLPFGQLTVVNTILGVTANYSANNIQYYSGSNSQTITSSPSNPSNNITLPNFSTTLAGLAGAQTFTGTKTFNALTNFPGGISAAGATFEQSIKTTDIVERIDFGLVNGGLYLNNKALSYTSIGAQGKGNFTALTVDDNNNQIILENPYGLIYLGDSDGNDSGLFISYEAMSGQFSGNSNSAIVDFNTISSISGFYETVNSIRVTNNARSWFL